MSKIEPQHAGRVTRVRVFIDRAVVTRRLVLPAFSERVSVGPISAKIDAESFRAKAVLKRAGESAPLRVALVSAMMIHNEPPEGRREEVQKKLEALTDKMSELTDLSEHQNRLHALLERYGRIVTDTLSWEWLDRSTSFEKWTETLDVLRGAGEKLALRRADEQAATRALASEKADLLEEERRVGQPEELGYSVEITFEPPKDTSGELELELSYETREAQWMPSYDLRYERGPQGLKARLEAAAVVRQRTGESWEGVELVATTARPPLSEPPPELMTLELRGRLSDRAALVTREGQSPRTLLGGPGQGGATADGVEFRAPGPVHIPSSGEPVRIDLFAGDLSASDRLEIVPTASPLPLRVAELGNTTGKILLPGTVNLFVQGVYSGHTEIAFVLPGERFSIALAREACVFAKRTRSQRPDEERRFSGNKVRSYDIRTTVENLSAQPVTVWLRDRVPVAGTEEVRIELEGTKGVNVDLITGLTLMELQLAPRQIREIDGSFSITAAAGFVVPSAEA